MDLIANFVSKASAMIRQLEISHFKSIRRLALTCKRVNVFVGAPNTGKTNILEALALLSSSAPSHLKSICRFETMDHLFFNFDLTEPISVETDLLKAKLSFDAAREEFRLELRDSGEGSWVYPFDFKGTRHPVVSAPYESSVLFYEFRDSVEFGENAVSHLAPPHGTNLPFLLKTQPKLRELVSEIFRDHGLRLNIKPFDHQIEFVKAFGEAFVSFPLRVISTTLRRLMFLLLAIESNAGKTLLLDEPEAKTFPFFTRYLAERMAFSPSNQFFLTTHNPYLLQCLLEKTPVQDLAIHVVSADEQGETRCRVIAEDQFQELFELDLFYNLEDFQL